MGSFLTGCFRADLNAIERMNPVGPRVNAVLQSQYLVLANSAAARGNHLNTNLYASKARLAARGEAVRPELPGARDIPSDKLDDLNVGRSKLIVALAETQRIKSPQKAARAQTMFDCWVIAEDIKNKITGDPSCRKKFLAALKDLQMALHSRQ